MAEPIANRAGGPEGGPAAAYRRQQRPLAPDVEERPVLAGEGEGREVFGGGGRAHCYRQFRPRRLSPAQTRIRGANRRREILRHGTTLNVRLDRRRRSLPGGRIVGQRTSCGSDDRLLQAIGVDEAVVGRRGEVIARGTGSPAAASFANEAPFPPTSASVAAAASRGSWSGMDTSLGIALAAFECCARP
jgi:hypothetical protein